jgi:hypothetical protein
MLLSFHEISPDCEKKTGVTIAVQTWKGEPHAETRHLFENIVENSVKMRAPNAPSKPLWLRGWTTKPKMMGLETKETTEL